MANVYVSNKKDLVRRVQELEAENKRLKSKNKKLKSEKITDELTNLYNYRYFDKSLELEIKKSYRHNYSVSLFMIDVDDFKKYNDKYGHIEGNKALKKIAKIIKENIRKEDIPFRYGGEELAVIMPFTPRPQDTKLNDLSVIGERLLDKIRSDPYLSSRKVTISIGAATYPLEKNVLERADKSLYKAKETGKNKLVIYSK